MRDRETYVLKQMSKCQHFNGIQNDRCKAGVRYEPKGPLPCWVEDREPGWQCDKRELHTREQAEADFEDMERSMARFRLVMTAVKPWRTWTKQNRVAKQEVIECPACKGRLHLSQAAYNGHVWGKCETPACVEWME